MDEELKKQLFSAVDESIKKNVEELVGPQVAQAVENKVKEMRLERAMTGKDVTGLDEEQREAFLGELRSIMATEKAGHFTFSDQAGGYLVTTDIYNGILRIAATSGIIARDARCFTIGSSELEIPTFTGEALQGYYLGEDQEGGEENVKIGVARLYTKSWQTIIRLSSKMVAEARIDIVDWLLALVGEGLAYRLDREGFMGGTFVGSPFIGIFSDKSEIPVKTLATGGTGFASFGIVEAVRTIAAVPTSALPGAAFYFHRTTWAEIATRSNNGTFEFSNGNSNFATLRNDIGIQPVAEIKGYPVYNLDILPAFSTSGINKKFGFFGDMSKVLAFVDKGPMAIAKSTDATVNGRNLFTSNQVAYRMTHEHGLAMTLPSAGVVLKTAAA